MNAFICTGGRIDADRITERPEQDDLVIAADSGLRNAEALGISPAVLVGDFDSLGEPTVSEEVELIRVPAEKNETDTQLAVSLALERGAKRITIVGGLSGRVDHTVSSLAILEWLRDKGVSAILTDGKNRARFLRNGSELIPRSERFRYLSLLAADDTVRGVTVEGCKYPLQNAKLSKRNQYAVSNEITGNCALVSVRRGGLWIIESTD